MANEIMKVENLELNHEYKNWKEVCKVLEISTMEGNTKKKNIKKLNELTIYEKKGHKFIFTKIKKHDIINTINLQDHSAQLQLIIFNKVLQSYRNGVPIHASLRILLEDFSLINSNYNKYHYNQKQLSKILNVEEKFISEAYVRSYNTLKKKVESILNKLKNEWFIIWDKDVYIGGIVYTDYTHETGAIRQSMIDAGLNVNKPTKEKFYRRMTDWEKKKFVGAKERIGYDMGYRDEFSILMSGKWKEFSENVCLELSEIFSGTNMKTHINYFHTSYNIYINDDSMELLNKRIEQLVFENPDEENKKMLMLTYDALMKNNINLTKKAQEQYNKALKHHRAVVIGKVIPDLLIEYDENNPETFRSKHRVGKFSSSVDLRLEKDYFKSNEKILKYVISPIEKEETTDNTTENTIEEKH